MSLSPAKAGWRVELHTLSPVLRLGLAYVARVAGSKSKAAQKCGLFPQSCDWG
jgi:hypothetical protein